MTARRRRLPLFVLAALALAPAAWAQSNRTFVSVTGSDANPCSATAPCRNFAAALLVTRAGGEVVALDSGGYGSLFINQSVQIVAAPGIHAGVTAGPGADAVQINGFDNTVVVLRGLALQASGGRVGINVFRVGALHVEDVTINDFSFNGVEFHPSNGGELFMRDTTVRMGDRRAAAVAVTGGSATSRAHLERVLLESSAYGLLAQAGAKVTVRESAAVDNDFVGFAASSAASPVELNLENCLAMDNGAGLSSSGPATVVRVSGSTVTQNTTGLSAASGGVILSRSNNTVEANGGGESFTGTFVSK